MKLELLRFNGVIIRIELAEESLWTGAAKGLVGVNWVAIGIV